MASQLPSPPGVPSERKKRGMVPPEIMELIVPPLKVGTFSGMDVLPFVLHMHYSLSIQY